jgi:hypothetical protein
MVVLVVVVTMQAVQIPEAAHEETHKDTDNFLVIGCTSFSRVWVF